VKKMEFRDRPLGAGGKRVYAGGLRASDVDSRTTVMGWVAGRRDLGRLVFLDLRDRSGVLQVVFDPEVSPEAHAAAKELRAEWVVRVDGAVAPRIEGQVNPDMPTGEVELRAERLEVLNRSRTPPFELDQAQSAAEELRLRYRYIDLRRPELLANFVLRDQVIRAARGALNAEGFIDVETPILIKSTPEGARDYLVPSRMQKGSFYALPQSPQILKQVLQISGFEKYFQIARCFRDEDLRADRQPEFTQLDLEASFVKEEDIFALMEGVMVAMWKAAGEELSTPFPRLSYQESMDHYGTDKPDMRFGLEIVNLDDLVEGSGFRVFTSALEAGGSVRGIRVPGGGDATRKQRDAWEEIAKAQGAGGLLWMKVGEEEISSPIVKHAGEKTARGICGRMEAGPGDLVLMVAGETAVARAALGELRLVIGRERGLVPEGVWAPLWVYPFPLLEPDAETGGWASAHHPFCAPFPEDVELMDSDPGRVRARTYDMVLNGYELGTGSIRIHDQVVQRRVFEMLGIAPDEAEERFGFLLEALTYGAPPHGGIALGIDRIVMLLARCSSLRDVVVFPKTTSAQCLLTGAPSRVDDRQLGEVGIQTLGRRGGGDGEPGPGPQGEN